MQAEVETKCPFCGEPITIFVDATIEDQNYTEDCSVCCRPIEFTLRCEDGEVVEIESGRGT